MRHQLRRGWRSSRHQQQQQQQPPTPQPDQGFGQLDLRLESAAMRISLLWAKVFVQVGQQPPLVLSWGRHVYNLPAGHYRIAAWYDAFIEAGNGMMSASVPIYPGHATAVRFKASNLRLLGTSDMRIEGITRFV